MGTIGLMRMKMTNDTNIKLFQNQNGRLKWDDEIEDYYFLVVDVVGIFSGSKNSSQYLENIEKQVK